MEAENGSTICLQTLPSAGLRLFLEQGVGEGGAAGSLSLVSPAPPEGARAAQGAEFLHCGSSIHLGPWDWWQGAPAAGRPGKVELERAVPGSLGLAPVLLSGSVVSPLPLGSAEQSIHS